MDVAVEDPLLTASEGSPDVLDSGSEGPPDVLDSGSEGPPDMLDSGSEGPPDMLDSGSEGQPLEQLVKLLDEDGIDKGPGYLYLPESQPQQALTLDEELDSCVPFTDEDAREVEEAMKTPEHASLVVCSDEELNSDGEVGRTVSEPVTPMKGVARCSGSRAGSEESDDSKSVRRSLLPELVDDSPVRLWPLSKEQRFDVNAGPEDPKYREIQAKIAELKARKFRRPG